MIPVQSLMIWLQQQTRGAKITRKAAEKVREGVEREEVYGEMMRMTKGNMQHHILEHPTAESARKRLGLMFIKSV